MELLFLSQKALTQLLNTVEDKETVAENYKKIQAYATAQAIWDKLHRRANYQLPGAIYVYFGYATTNIEDFDKDTNQRKVVKLQMRFTYRPLEATS